MARAIAMIDKDITANMRELRRRHPIKNPFDAACWQAARDAHPDLDARDHALYRERGEAQQERDDKAWQAMRKANRSASARRTAACRQMGRPMTIRQLQRCAGDWYNLIYGNHPLHPGVCA